MKYKKIIPITMLLVSIFAFGSIYISTLKNKGVEKTNISKLDVATPINKIENDSKEDCGCNLEENNSLSEQKTNESSFNSEIKNKTNLFNK